MDAIEAIETKATALRGMLDKLIERDNDGQFDDKYDVIQFVKTYVEAVEEMIPAKPIPVSQWRDAEVQHCRKPETHGCHTRVDDDGVVTICPGGSYIRIQGDLYKMRFPDSATSPEVP